MVLLVVGWKPVTPGVLDITYSHVKDMYSAPANLITIKYPLNYV